MDESTSHAHGFRVPMQLRFRDTDGLGHINNAVFSTFCEIGRTMFFMDLGISVSNLILARIALDFKRQVHLGDDVVVETAIVAVGRTSVSIRQVVYANDDEAALAKSVVVHFDYDTQQSSPWPQVERESFDVSLRSSKL